ncbi:unnamed protein product [Caenorhabditis angaria]|uniref:Chitin-binding type-2 domain-containing protein n=1 Tax=Caenorhabditis angaria TaxID=860376 RepID=A0A9P1IZD0_9PELO|nr:unnamed protein product [Caenorhabditis angaria]
MGTNLTLLISFLLTLAVNTYEIPNTSSQCPPNYNGSIAGSACSQEYTLCVNGIQQAAVCQEGFVFYENALKNQRKMAINRSHPHKMKWKQKILIVHRKKMEHIKTAAAIYSSNVSMDKAYPMFCPSNLVYLAEYNQCLESCDAVPPQVEIPTTTAPSTDEVYDEPTIPSVSVGEHFDCSNLEDGNYVEGCSSVYYVCSNGNTLVSHCPAGLVYNHAQKVCEYTCDSTTTTSTSTTTIVPTTEEVVAEEEPIDIYTPVPTEDTTTTEAEVLYSSSTTTTEAPIASSSELPTSSEEPIPTSSEEPISSSSEQPVATSTVADDAVPVPVATSTVQPIPEVTSGYSVNSNQVCQNGQITSFGSCASRFSKCQNNAIVNKQCPVNTLFESALLLCVYDLPQCQPSVTPIQHFIYQQSDRVVSPFDDSIALRPRRYRPNRNRGPSRRPIFDDQQYIDNPFFVPPRRSQYRRRGPSFRRRQSRRFLRPSIDSAFASPFHRRAFVSDVYSDNRRTHQGKIEYGNSRVAQGDRTFVVDDAFKGARRFGFHSNINDVFPKSATQLEVEGSGYNPQKGFEDRDREEAEVVEDEGPEEPVLTRRKRYAPVSAPTTYSTQTTATYTNTQQNNRQAQVNQNCQGVTTPQFFNFGQCFDEFIYCSGTGVNRFAACPIGEQFDTTINSCSSVCGNSSTSADVTVGGYDFVSSSTTSSPIGEDQTTTTSQPIAVTVETTTSYGESTTSTAVAPTPAPVGDRCNGINEDLVALGCSQEYIHCSGGIAIRRLCPAALYFDEIALVCNYREAVAACNGSDDTPSVFQTTQKPSQVSTTTTSSPQESTYGPTVATPYKPTTTTVTSGYGQIVSACSGLTDGAHGSACATSFNECANGTLVKTSICKPGEGFDPSVGECINFEDISDCSQQPTTGTPVVGNDETTTTAATTVPSNSYSSSCQSGARASIGFCASNYLECVENAYISQSCETDQVFDSNSNKCVAKENCGQASVYQVIKNNGKPDSSQQGGYRSVDNRCALVSNNSVVSIGQCRNRYIRCIDSTSSIENCQPNQVFCNVQLKCVDKWSIPHCARAAAAAQSSYGGVVAQAQPFNYGGAAGDAFCQGKSDGLYKNPSDCSAILQCFGGDLFEYPSCPSGLAFNEISGKCDYPQNVPGCDVSQDDQGSEVGGCGVHGAFIADSDNCSIFYRCVWGRRVEMTCPSGTVFNPSLSVCDWPSSVPSCNANASPSDESDQSSYSSAYQ